MAGTSTEPIVPANPTPPEPSAEPTATEPAEPAAPFAVFRDAESFNKRIAQAARAQLREIGIESPEKLKEMQDGYSKLQEEAEQRRQAQQTELEREREQREKFESEAKVAEEAREEAARKADLYELFAKKGIRNCDYAYWETLRELDKLDEGETLDSEKFVAEMLADEDKAKALGIAPVVTPRGATDTDAERDPTPPAPGSPPQEKSVHEMTKEEFAQQTQKKYGFTSYS